MEEDVREWLRKKKAELGRAEDVAEAKEAAEVKEAVPEPAEAPVQINSCKLSEDVLKEDAEGMQVVDRPKVYTSMEKEDPTKISEPRGANVIMPIPDDIQEAPRKTGISGLLGKLLIAIGGSLSAVAVYLLYRMYF